MSLATACSWPRNKGSSAGASAEHGGHPTVGGQRLVRSARSPHNGVVSRTPRFDLSRGVVEPVVLMISRREVEANDIDSVFQRLEEQFRLPAVMWRYRGQMALVVDGYNDDPRELVDIPAVRAFLRGLDARWPFWAFFFNAVDDSIKILASCVAGCRFPGHGMVEIDPDRLRDFLMRGFAAMNSIFDEHGFPEDELESMSRSVIEVIEQAGFN